MWWLRLHLRYQFWNSWFCLRQSQSHVILNIQSISCLCFNLQKSWKPTFTKIGEMAQLSTSNKRSTTLGYEWRMAHQNSIKVFSCSRSWVVESFRSSINSSCTSSGTSATFTEAWNGFLTTAASCSDSSGNNVQFHFQGIEGDHQFPFSDFPQFLSQIYFNRRG